MFCPNCGFQYEGEFYFCPKCGVGFQNQTRYTVPLSGRPMQPMAPAMPRFSNKPVVNTIKSMGASGGFLIATIIYTIMLVVTFLNVGNINRIAYLMGERSSLGSVGEVISALIQVVPMILIAIGLWITFGSAANRSSSGMSTSGLSIIRGVMIFQLVILCILAFVSLMWLIVGASNISSSRKLSQLILSILIVGAVLFLMIVYYVKTIETISTMMSAIERDIPFTEGISTFAAVMNIILGGIIALGLMTVLLEGLRYGGFFLIQTVISYAGQATLYIMFGVYILIFKQKMKFQRSQKRPTM